MEDKNRRLFSELHRATTAEFNGTETQSKSLEYWYSVLALTNYTFTLIENLLLFTPKLSV